jgi:hypothetical protein
VLKRGVVVQNTLEQLAFQAYYSTDIQNKQKKTWRREEEKMSTAYFKIFAICDA